MRNQLRRLKDLVYSLKMSFGSRADVYYESADSVDLATGVRTVAKVKYTIRRAVCLPTVTSAESLFPSEIKRIWKRDAAVETGSKVVLIDRRDLPEGLRVETHNWSVVIDHRRYEVLKVEEFETGVAYLLTLKELAGARVYEQVDVCVTDEVEGTDNASGS